MVAKEFGQAGRNSVDKAGNGEAKVKMAYLIALMALLTGGVFAKKQARTPASSSTSPTVLTFTPGECMVLRRKHKSKSLEFAGLVKGSYSDYHAVCKLRATGLYSCKDGTGRANFMISLTRASDNGKRKFFDQILEIGDSQFVAGTYDVHVDSKTFSFNSFPAGDTKSGVIESVTCVGTVVEL